jgi:hypothetical protein
MQKVAGHSRIVLGAWQCFASLRKCIGERKPYELLRGTNNSSRHDYFNRGMRKLSLTDSRELLLIRSRHPG